MLVWYTVVTALFRCPTSITELTESSPQVCKPYLTARSYVSPYLEPYYNTYAAPYVDEVRPYVDTLNGKVLSPSLKYGNQTYHTYGAPRVEQARVYGTQQWDTTLKPQLETARKQARKQYDASLAPQVDKVSALVGPYYSSGVDGITYTYDTYLLPAYAMSRPYGEKAYAVAHSVAVDTGLPYAQAAWTSTVVFADRTLWPRLRILYGENVEPQLIRIGERLGRYRDGRKLRAAMEESSRYVNLPSPTIVVYVGS